MAPASLSRTQAPGWGQPILETMGVPGGTLPFHHRPPAALRALLTVSEHRSNDTMPAMADEPTEVFYTTGEVAKALGLSEATVLALLTSGQLEGQQDEWARWIVPLNVVDKAKKSQEQVPVVPADPSADTISSPDPASAEETLHYAEPPETDAQRSYAADISGQDTASSGWTNTDTAAKALGVSPRTVRRFIDRRELEGRKIVDGIVESWEVSIDSLYALRDKRGVEGQARRDDRRKSVEEDAPAAMADMIRNLTSDLVRSSSEAAYFRARLELTERAESSLREDLEREREERQRYQEEANRLLEELEAERSKGFWRRLFGG